MAYKFNPFTGNFDDAGVDGHNIHDEVAAALTSRTELHFMGNGLFAQDNAGSTRTEVIAGAYYDAIVDNADTNGVGKGNIYSTLRLAIDAGHKVIFCRNLGDASDVTIASGDTVTTIAGNDAQSTTVPVNIICNKADVAIQDLQFSGKTLTLNGARDVAFRCAFTGAVTSFTALINNGAGITAAATSIAYDGGVSGSVLPTSGIVKIENEYISYTGGGNAVNGTLTGCVRAQLDSLGETHGDNVTITSIYQASVIVTAIDCQVIACRFVACTTTTAHCVRIGTLASKCRIVTCVFTSNATLTCIALCPEGSQAIQNSPVGVMITGNSFDSNTGVVDSLIAALPKENSLTLGEVGNLSINGNLIRNYNCTAILMHAWNWNISGNLFDASTDGLSPNGLTYVINAPGDTNSGGTVTYAATTLTDTSKAWAKNQWNGHTATVTETGSGGTVTYGAASLTDTSKAWTTNQWAGAVVTSGANTATVLSNTATVLTMTANWAPGTPAAGAAYSIPNSGAITSNTATVLTVSSWVQGTPSAGHLYTLPAGLSNSQQSIPYNTPGGAGTLAPRGVLIIDKEFITFGKSDASYFYSCVRGAYAAAATHTNGTTIFNESQRCLYNRNSEANAYTKGCTITGNNIIAHTVAVHSNDKSNIMSRLLLADNGINNCTTLYGAQGYVYFNNAFGGSGINLELRGKVTQVLMGGANDALILTTNIAAVPTDFWMWTGLGSGTNTTLWTPPAKVMTYDRLSTGTGGVGVAMKNKTGGASVQYDAVVVNTALANSVLNTGTNSALVFGVFQVGGIADGSDEVVQTGGYTSVNVDTRLATPTAGAIAIGDLLSMSPTAGMLMKAPAGALFGTVLGYAMAAQAVNLTGTIRMLLRKF